MKFDIETIDNIMLDIEGLALPVEKHHPVLMLVLGAIEHYAPDELVDELVDEIRMEYGHAELPEFLKKQVKRDVEDALKGEMPHAGWVWPKFDDEAPEPRTSVAPQEAFSPAPVPSGVQADVPEKDIESPSPHGVRWTEGEELVLIKGRLEGKPFKDLAEVLGRKEPTCASKMHWLTQHHAKRIERIKAELGPELGKKAGPAYDIGPWTEDMERRLQECRHAGVPFKVIAAEMNRPVKGVTQKFYNLRDAAHEKAHPSSKPASKTIGEIAPAPAEVRASKAEGGAGILPRPYPDKNWPIEDDLDLVSEHHSGLSMLDVSVILERTKPDCVARYTALIKAMPAGGMTERQALLKKTLAYHAAQARKAA